MNRSLLAMAASVAVGGSFHSARAEAPPVLRAAVDVGPVVGIERSLLRTLVRESLSSEAAVVVVDSSDAPMVAVQASMTGRQKLSVRLTMAHADGHLLGYSVRPVGKDGGAPAVRRAVSALLKKVGWPPPEWVARGSGVFPPDLGVLYAVGTKSGLRNKELLRMATDNMARAEMSKLYDSVSAEVLKRFAEAHPAPPDPIDATEEALILHRPPISATVLSGVEIVGGWMDPTDGTFYSMARLRIVESFTRLFVGVKRPSWSPDEVEAYRAEFLTIMRRVLKARAR